MDEPIWDPIMIRVTNLVNSHNTRQGDRLRRIRPDSRAGASSA